MPRFAATVFLSAFLLFQVQPMVGKALLPWFGGAPAVWTTCLLFFQAVLLGGYAWSHLVVARLSARAQARAHLGLLALAVLALGGTAVAWRAPLLPDASLAPGGGAAPVPQLLRLLALSVGLPYLALAATGPLLQAWVARSVPTAAALRLYALSNLGSLLGLLAYPFGLEPLLPLRAQAWLWSAGFATFALLCGGVAVTASRTPPPPPEVAATPPGPRPWGWWVALPAVASALLLAVTTHLTQEVAPVPFLWVLPLALYLVSFIVTFESARWYHRGWAVPLLGALALVVAGVLTRDTEPSALVAVPLWSGFLFVAAVAAHGEVVRRRPAAEGLTAFYLAVSAGGALGGALVAVVAPLVFTGVTELPLGIGAVVALVAAAALGGTRWRWAGAAVTGLVAGTLWLGGQARAEGVLEARRDFFGALRVVRSGAGAEARRVLLHGRILHGVQWDAPGRRGEATAYYAANSGIAQALRMGGGRPARVGVVGLGLGTVAAWGRPGDVYRFYELSPEVIALARGSGGHFSFLADSAARVAVVEGDARTSLERELRAGSQRYDVLAVDAFSSDSVPAHLLTAEALALYLAHLADEASVLAFHLSNRYLDLVPVVGRLAREAGLQAALVTAPGDGALGLRSKWLLVSRTSLRRPGLEAAVTDWAPRSDGPRWTDDATSLWQVVEVE